MSKFFHPQLKRAFTLVEVLIVVAIITILASLILANLNTSRDAGEDAARLSALKEIEKALVLYALDNNGVFPVSDPRGDPAPLEGVGSGPDTWDDSDRSLFIPALLGDNTRGDNPSGKKYLQSYSSLVLEGDTLDFVCGTAGTPGFWYTTTKNRTAYTLMARLEAPLPGAPKCTVDTPGTIWVDSCYTNNPTNTIFDDALVCISSDSN